MSPIVTRVLQRTGSAGRKLGAGACQVVAKVFTFGFGAGAGAALVGMLMLLVGAAAFYVLTGGMNNGKQPYRHLIPLDGTSPDKGCGAQGNAIPTLVHPVQRDNAHRRLHEPFKTTDNSGYDCAIQHHVNQSVDYDLAFLEFNDEGTLIAPGQWTALEKHLGGLENLNVVVFVHGWRNDAHVGSEDVERFHTVLSLSANYAKQRIGVGKPATKTVGIFIGWQGRVMDEKDDTNDPEKGSLLSGVRARLAIPTILSRKPRSDAIAKSIGQQILNIETLVKGVEGAERHANKLVIMGHSLGGNIVIQGLSDTLVQRITASQSASQIRGVGDLVVLINPASQARHFFAVQQAAFANKKPPFGSPVVVSLTAAKYFDQITNDSRAWDTAVGQYFPWAQWALTLGTGRPEDVQSIGNYLPNQLRDRKTDAVLSEDLKGVSHEMELDTSAGVTTTYAFAGTAQAICPAEEPAAFMAWQRMATLAKANPPPQGQPFTARAVQTIQENAKTTAGHDIGWDTNFKKEAGGGSKTGMSTTHSWFTLSKPAASSASSASSATGSIRVNIRHGAVRHGCLKDAKDKAFCRHVAEDAGQKIDSDQYVDIPVIGPAWSPVWNVAAHANVIDEHGGYLSHSLWCVLNRFALDRPAPAVSVK